LKGILTRTRLAVVFALLIALLIGGLLTFYLMENSDDEAGLHRLTGESFLFQSAGHFSDISYVQRLAANDRITLQRGLTLVGLVGRARPERLAHMDTCSPGDPVRDEVPITDRFISVIEATDWAFGAYAILAHDSIRCGQNANLERLFKGLGLKEWRQVGFRQPYVALLSDDDSSQEFLAGEGEVLALMGDANVSPTSPIRQSERAFLPRVAHAGGGFMEQTYTNSIKALDHNVEHFELFEIDFSWTSDDELVCLHDWDKHFESVFGYATEEAVTLDEFLILAREQSLHEPCTLATLAEWMEANPDKRIVTDIKERNAEALVMIVERFPALQEQFIPQVYQPAEYFAARQSGYDDVIWTLYRYPGSNSDVLALLPTMDLYGLTMTQGRAREGLAEQALQERGVLSWVHTINDRELVEEFMALGVADIYTDWLKE
jgi:glycerophosphoryl diester phosphodiesterase